VAIGEVLIPQLEAERTSRRQIRFGEYERLLALAGDLNLAKQNSDTGNISGCMGPRNNMVIFHTLSNIFLHFTSLHCSICIVTSWLRVGRAAMFTFEFGLAVFETGRVATYTWKKDARITGLNTELCSSVQQGTIPALACKD